MQAHNPHRARMRAGSGGGGAGPAFLLSPDAPSHWMLGVKYDEDDLEGWTSDYRSIPWLTYRSGFRAMEPYSYTDDAGWGCMLRSAQMLMAHALLRHRLGRQWRAPWDADRLKECEAFTEMLLWFADVPGRKCIYSIHNMVQVGMNYDKLPGEWYGPSTSAYVLRDLALVHRQCLGGSLRVMVTQAEVIYIDDVRATACSSSSPQPPEDAATPPPSSSDPPSFYDPLLHLPPKLLEEERRRSCSSALWSTDGLVILVPLRLGLNGLNPIYIPGLQATLQFPQSLGFIGGKPNHALYFVGMRGTELTGLDPHTIQTAPQVPMEVQHKAQPYTPSDDYVRSVQCRHPQTMQFKDLDPSLALGFYIRNEKDFTDLQERTSALIKQLSSKGLPSPFTIEQAPPNYEGTASVASMISALDEDDDEEGGGSDQDVEDEYVIIR